LKAEEIMTTMSIPTGINGRTAQLSSTLCAGNGLTGARRVPEWLPVPAAAPARKDTDNRPATGAAHRPRLWIRPEGAPLSEKVMFLVLTLAATAGIGYGFSCLLDLVQHWAVFGAGISRLVQ
jgi:hypothetical protein